MRLGRGTSIVLIIVAVLAGLGAYAYHVAYRVLELRIATGPAGGFGAQIATSIRHIVALEHGRVRVRISNLASEADALKALAEGRADLAVARADAQGPVGQTIVVLKHDAGLFVLPHGSKADSVASLRGMTVGVVGRFPADDARLLGTVRSAYGLTSEPAPIPLQPEDVADALHGKKVQAVFVVGAADGQNVRQTLAAVKKAGGGQPHLIEVDESRAIVKRDHLLESVDLPMGVLQGQPPLPSDDTSTIGVSTRLFASSAMLDTVAAEITRVLLSDKPRISSLLPAGAVVEPPDTEKLNASLPIHSGAAEYLSGNQPSISDEAQNALYWVGIIGSLFASCAAGIAALVARFNPPKQTASLKMLDLWVAAREAGPDRLDDVERQVDAVVQETVRQQVKGKGEEIGAAFPLLVTQVRRAIDARRNEHAGRARPAA